jgi:tetratricopeptide (TPR) repeat protein
MKALRFVLLLGVILIGFRFMTQEESGNRAYRRGEYPRAVDRYREAVARSGGGAELQYNLGTALLRVGEPEAVERLMQALEAQSPELRARAFYNLGNAMAMGPEGGEPSAGELRAAIDAYRRSLLLDPSGDHVRWNLELAMYRLEEEERNQLMQGPEQQPDVPPQGQGEGAGEQPQQGGDDSTFPRPGAERRQQGSQLDASEEPFPRELAEQILRAVEERERALQREKLRRQRRRTRGPDW